MDRKRSRDYGFFFDNVRSYEIYTFALYSAFSINDHASAAMYTISLHEGLQMHIFNFFNFFNFFNLHGAGGMGAARGAGGPKARD